MNEPTTLQEAIIYFSDPNNCREYLVARRWPMGVTCPRCGSSNVLFLEKYNRWHCREKHSAPQFTLKTGSIMEDSPVSLDKWLMAMWMVVNCKNGVSSYEIHRAIGVTQKTAWFLNHRIRLAFGMESPEKLSGHVEADETFIGGKARNMHASKRERRITGTGGKDKTAVMGILERGGKVRATVIPNRKKSALQAEVRKHVEAGSALYTDALQSYNGLDEFEHQVVDHAVQYVDGKIHTNGLENFWSLLKRSINGTWHQVSPKHLDRYVNEVVFRLNNASVKDHTMMRLNNFIAATDGKRLTYERLIA